MTREESIIQRAHDKGGECSMWDGEESAVLRLTELGIGHWEQRHPFIATFILDTTPEAALDSLAAKLEERGD